MYEFKAFNGTTWKNVFTVTLTDAIKEFCFYTGLHEKDIKSIKSLD